MVRPCFLVVDREFPGSISTRKLILETAKYNVITAYSAREAIETLRIYPRVTGVLMDTRVGDMECASFIHELRSITPGIPVVAIEAASAPHCEGPTFTIPFYTPEVLLDTIARIVPSETIIIREHEREIENKM
ncbi:MAG: response regulator [Acidobacteria bacterium]|nr:response regulator [Acidobacteriota bacterium]